MCTTALAPIDAARLAGLIDPAWWGPVEVRPEVGSTNAELAARARAGGRPQALTTESQPAGRGRLGRRWVAPPRSGLAVSVLVCPPVSPPRWGWLSLVAGLAVASTVRSAGVAAARVGVKWPNDVLVDGAKIAGILAERVDETRIVLGVGLNVHLTRDELPTPTATSLVLAGASVLDRTVLLARYLRELHEECARWWSEPSDEQLRTRYRQACTTLGRVVEVELPGRSSQRGAAVDVDPTGALIVDTGAVEPLRVAAGDVTHVRAG